MQTKLFSFIFFFSSLGWGFLFAQAERDDLQEQIDELRMQVNQIEGFSSHRTHAMLEPKEGKAWSFNFSASGLYWKPKVDLTDLGFQLSTDPVISNPSSAFPRNSRLVQQPIHWGWGFRVMADSSFLKKAFHLGASYTYFSAKGCVVAGFTDDEAGAISIDFLPTLLQNIIDEGIAVSAKRVRGDLNLYYDRGALTIAQSYCVRRYLDVEARCGLAFSWIDIQQKGFYSGGARPVFLGDSSVTFFSRDQFWGIGPTVALGAHWKLIGGLSLYTDLTGDLMFGKHDLDSYDNITELYQEVAKDTINRYLPMMTCQLGLAYHAFFQRYTQRLSISAGWEQQFWWNVYKELDAQNLVATGDLGLSGLTFKALFEF